MKGVILRLNPSATIIDVTHGIAPQNIVAGAMALRESARYFPAGTIHVAVVDPGVGGARRPLLIEAGQDYFIGPDNGLLSLAAEERQINRVVHLSDPSYHLSPRSGTFHGRDVFAPVAAHLSLGVPPDALGEPGAPFLHLRVPRVVQGEREVTGEIVYIDAFGNLFSNIRQKDLARWDPVSLRISLGNHTISGLSPNYAAGAGRAVALINSWGVLEIAVDQDSAARGFGATIGDKVRVWCM